MLGVPSVPEVSAENKLMKGWEIHEYGGINALQLNESMTMPTITASNQVLVEVHTTSLNTLDLLMLGL